MVCRELYRLRSTALSVPSDPDLQPSQNGSYNASDGWRVEIIIALSNKYSQHLTLKEESPI